MTELKKLQYSFSEEMKRGLPTPLVMKFGGGLNDTLAFDETVKGWTSFYDYKPTQMFSLRNKFYSTGKDNFYVSLKPVWGVRSYDRLYEHYSVDVNRSFFYARN